MQDPIQTALLFLINIIFDLYLFILMIRIILVWVGADYFNPLVQFVVKFTNFVVKPLRQWLPNFHRFETASICLVFVLALIKFLLISLLRFGMPNILGLLLLSVADFLRLILLTFFYAILMQAILSWVQPYNPATRVLYQFTHPVLHPFQRVIPPVGGFDISPLPALIILQLLIILVVNPLMFSGWGMAVR